MASAASLLEEVETAISHTLTAQSYSAPGGRQKQMADLKALMQFRKELVDEVANTSAGSMASLCELCDPSL